MEEVKKKRGRPKKTVENVLKRPADKKNVKKPQASIKPKKKNVSKRKAIKNAEKKTVEKLNSGGQPGNKNAEKWTEDIAVQIGLDLIAWMKESQKNVFYDEFLYLNNDYHPDLIGNLSEKFSSFGELIKKAKKIQETKLRLHCGNGRLHPTMSIFCLKNNHGYADRTESDVTTGGQALHQKIEVEIIK